HFDTRIGFVLKMAALPHDFGSFTRSSKVPSANLKMSILLNSPWLLPLPTFIVNGQSAIVTWLEKVPKGAASDATKKSWLDCMTSRNSLVTPSLNSSAYGLPLLSLLANNTDSQLIPCSGTVASSPCGVVVVTNLPVSFCARYAVCTSSGICETASRRLATRI